MHVDTAIVEPLLTLLSYDNYRIKPENVIKLSIQKASSNLPTHPQLDYDVLLLVCRNLYK